MVELCEGGDAAPVAELTGREAGAAARRSGVKGACRLGRGRAGAGGAEGNGPGGRTRALRAAAGGGDEATRGAQLVDRGGGAKCPAGYIHVRRSARQFFRVSGEKNPWISEGGYL